MLFNSFQFLVFFPIVVLFYFLLPHRWRTIFLLAASGYFYMAFIPKYILILALVIVIDYAAGIWIERQEGKRKKYFLIASIFSNVGVLFLFKYFNFFNENIAALSHFLHWNYGIQSLSLILPIGLSFHTFQSLSYVIEVYKGKQKAERNILTYALYVMFFPQLVAGPIERPQNLLHQFYEVHRFEWQRFQNGLVYILWGLFKKMVIADNAAALVNVVYGNPQSFTGIHFIIATVFFAFQIYCDFSGYSDIAIGTANILGFDLSTNFNHPYCSESVSEFWRRWHITLMQWFRDYIYIPLGGSRVGTPQALFNIFAIFLLSGLWHGAAWTFVVWGLLNALYVSVGSLTEEMRKNISGFLRLDRFPRLHKWIRRLVIFSLVSFAWIFFRAENLKDAWYIVTHLGSGLPQFVQSLGDLRALKTILSSLQVSAFFLFGLSGLIVFMEYIEYQSDASTILPLVSRKKKWIRFSLYYALVLAILFFAYQGNRPFIYFQF